MKRLPGLLLLGAMLALILDSKAAMEAASQGVELCLKTAVPSLFPFFVLSGMLVPMCAGLPIPGLGRLLGIPGGWESLFLLGCVGGYPVGAQCVCQGYAAGKISREDAGRLLGLCTNCGPSFLFGIVASKLGSVWLGAQVYLVCILSALMAGMLGSGRPEQTGHRFTMAPVSPPRAVQQGCRAMVSVCAWIILGKVLSCFLFRWGLRFLPAPAGVFVSGLLELTNGCLMLGSIESEALRFLFACVFTSFGGVCVVMQVAALCGDAGLGCRSYLPHKALQGALSAILAAGLRIHPGIPIFTVFGLFLCKIALEKNRGMMYNTVSKGGIVHVIPKKDAKVLSLLHPQHKAQ